jgi:DNA-binding response OmpR family regulator
MNARILVIDDLQDSLSLLRELITRHLPMSVVETANSGALGLERARAWKPDLVLLDANMPGMDGFEVCRRLRSDAATADVRILMISGVLKDSENRVAGMESGADSYLSKPFETQELISQLKVLFRGKQSEDELRRHKTALERDLAQRTARLQKNEAQLRLLLEQMPALLWTTDDTLRFTSAAGKGLSQGGITTGTGAGKAIAAFFQTEDAAASVLDAHRKALEGTSTCFNFHNAERDYTCHIEPFTDRDGRIMGAIGIALDTSESIRAAEKLRQTEDLSLIHI